jgi:RNA polymerase sigma-70 factor (ECF subfamily)
MGLGKLPRTKSQSSVLLGQCEDIMGSAHVLPGNAFGLPLATWNAEEMLQGSSFNGEVLQDASRVRWNGPARWTCKPLCCKLAKDVVSSFLRPRALRHLAMENPGQSPEPSSGTSRSLLERVQAADSAAWNRLVFLYAPLVFQWCRRWDLQEQDVSDILQEVFGAVVKSIGGFRKDKAGATFRGWLRTITQNKVRDHFRRLGREPAGIGGTDAQVRLAQFPVPMDSEPGSNTIEPADQVLFFRALELIRSEFEERTWQAFWRTAIEDQSPKDVAADLSMSPCAVRVAKCRVLHRLREELGDVRE